MALFNVEILLSNEEIPPKMDASEAIRMVEMACGALVGLGRVDVSLVRPSDDARSGITIRNGDERVRLSDGAVERLSAIVRATVRQALFPCPRIVG